jgi:hypothetical protein
MCRASRAYWPLRAVIGAKARMEPPREVPENSNMLPARRVTEGKCMAASSRWMVKEEKKMIQDNSITIRLIIDTAVNENDGSL